MSKNIIVTTNYKNNNVSVIFYEKTEDRKAYIYGTDLTDFHNMPTFFTRKVRGIEKAWLAIEQLFNDENIKDTLTMYDIIKLLDSFNLGVHSYCAMD